MRNSSPRSYFYGRGTEVPKIHTTMKQHDHRRRSDNNRFDHERLRFAIRASGLYTGSFARRIGLPDSEALYDVLTGLAPLSPELARRIHACYPQIDLEWLMTGRIRGIELPAAGQSDV